MIKHLTLLLAIALAPCFALAAEKSEAQKQWEGLYKGVYCIVLSNGAKSKPVPLDLRIGEHTGSPANVVVNFSPSIGDDLDVYIMNIEQRAKNKPPTITEDRFLMPAIFANPIQFDAKIVKGGFDEDIVEGTIITYKLSVEGPPVVDMRIEFKAGKLQ